MKQPPKAFSDWYSSLKVVKANNGPANGSIATALVVLERLKEEYNLDFNAMWRKEECKLEGQAEQQLQQF